MIRNFVLGCKLKRLDPTCLRLGDIILTSANTIASAIIRNRLGGPISHAILYVEHCSIIDSTPRGVKASNTQRLFFADDDVVIALRPKNPFSPEQLAKVINYARTQIDVRYNYSGAARSLFGRGPAEDRRQFCSRLVAQSYAQAQVRFTNNVDYCSPQDILGSELLDAIHNVTEPVTEADIAYWKKRPDGVREMWNAQDKLMLGARRLDNSFETIDDVIRYAIVNQDKDEKISRIINQSGYLEVWRFNLKVNPWQYDIHEMLKVPENEIDEYCRRTLSDELLGGSRYHTTLYTLRGISARFNRKSVKKLEVLYEKLVELHSLRVQTARQWVDLKERRTPKDKA